MIRSRQDTYPSSIQATWADVSKDIENQTPNKNENGNKGVNDKKKLLIQNQNPYFFQYKICIMHTSAQY